MGSTTHILDLIKNDSYQEFAKKNNDKLDKGLTMSLANNYLQNGNANNIILEQIYLVYIYSWPLISITNTRLISFILSSIYNQIVSEDSSRKHILFN